jgi:hypothetical protein
MTLLGLSATQVVESLPDLLPDITRYNLISYTPRDGVDRRVRRMAAADPSLRKLEAVAPEILETITGLAGAISAANDQTGGILKEMLRHDDSKEKLPESAIDASALKRFGLAPILARLSPDQGLGLCSDVVLRDGYAHLPLLDFSLIPSTKNVALVQEAARALMLPHAIVLESGRSYHVYGLSLLSHDDWVNFLTRALLLAPMVDVRYIAHRLLAGHAVLRINATSAKPMEPRVVAAY